MTKHLSLSLSFFLLFAVAASRTMPDAQAQTYPDHPLRLVVPFATGGTSDILARFVAPPLWAALGQPVVVDNRPGAGSNFGSSGNGGIGHLVGEMFKSATGVNMVHVPYKGNGPALVDLMSGVLNLTFTDIAGGMPYIKAGRMRPLAIASKRRSALLPDVPTMIEAGVPGFEASTWFAVFATGGTPQPVINRLNTEIVKSLQSPDMRDKLTNLGCEVVGSKPEELAA